MRADSGVGINQSQMTQFPGALANGKSLTCLASSRLSFRRCFHYCLPYPASTGTVWKTPMATANPTLGKSNILFR
jgi:hypothetical protein